jgi:hypothetical protein
MREGTLVTENLGNFAGGLGLDKTVGGVTAHLGNLVNGIIKAGPGGTITQDMVNQANEISPSWTRPTADLTATVSSLGDLRYSD